jgi:hypothetical protein
MLGALRGGLNKIQAPKSRKGAEMMKKSEEKAKLETETFGKWIKAKRHGKRRGLWRCACDAHVGGEVLRLIEAGRSNPAGCKVETLYGIAKALDLALLEVIERAMAERPDVLEWLEKYAGGQVN